MQFNYMDRNKNVHYINNVDQMQIFFDSKKVYLVIRATSSTLVLDSSKMLEMCLLEKERK